MDKVTKVNVVDCSMDVTSTQCPRICVDGILYIIYNLFLERDSKRMQKYRR